MLVEAIPTVGKNTQQIKGAILKQVKAYEKLLNAFCGSARVEASLVVHLQVRCAERPCGNLHLCRKRPKRFCWETSALRLPATHQAPAAYGRPVCIMNLWICLSLLAWRPAAASLAGG